MSTQTELTRITNAKAAVKAAIEGKGVTVPDGTLLDGMAPLIESIEAGGVGVQSDWNQNDETAPDYIKNRPFYTGNPVETVLVEESTVSFSFSENEGIYMGELRSTFSATVGETYKVYWDGTVYECTCVDFSDGTTIGNLSIAGAGSDTGEPFLMDVHNGQGILIGTADTSASHTVSISRLVPEVVKIDKKYLVQPDWNQNDSTQPDYIKNRPFYTGDPVETVFVEESTITFSGNEGVYTGKLKSTFSATVGETYKVSWDGTVYECTCAIVSGLPAIGNLSIAGAGSDTGEPFLMVVHNGQEIRIGTADTSASHTVSISGYAGSVVKIDGKYLPNTIATKSEVKAAQTTASNAQTTASNAQTTANHAQTTANNAKSEALDLAARMFGHTSVVDNAFYYDKTLSITSLPACIESIGNGAFSGCTNLALTSLPSGITSIGVNAFQDCKNLALTSLPSGLTSISDNAFLGCTKLALTSLPSGLTSIGNGAFFGCTKLALTSLPSGLTSIGDDVFFQCTNLALTSLPSGLTSIGDHTFTRCFNLALTSLPSGITSIGVNAFQGCKNLALTSLPSGLTSIGDYVFDGCTNLAPTSLPSGLTSIGNSAFYNCTKLTSITFTGTPTSIGSSAFSGCTNLTTINVPWAEGEVANAPWGATNATINYNYTGA